MKKNKLSLILIALCSIWISCTNTIKKDAEEAAGLMNKSMEAARNYDFELSESYFKQYKAIETKYIEPDKKEEFDKLYRAHVNG